MPRNQKWIYICGHCGTKTEEPLQLGTHGDWGLAMTLSGPGWSLLLEGEEWFCSADCFLRWLRSKITNVVLTEQEMDCDIDRSGEPYYEWPQP